MIFRQRSWFVLAPAVLGFGVIILLLCKLPATVKLPTNPGPSWNAPSPDAAWPWTRAAVDSPVQGVTHWSETSADGAALTLVQFDFTANPRLRFEMYDQDQDSPLPWSDHVAISSLGVAQAMAHLDSTGHGNVIAATNGLFFNPSGHGLDSFATHVSPVVVDGVPHFAGGENYRWTFGVKYVGGNPRFDACLTPTKKELAQNFDFAAGSAQVLIWDGVPAATPAEQSGEYSSFETMRTSRVSWGWSRDSARLYLLFVEEPESATPSRIAAEHHLFRPGGWMIADERRLWQSLGVWRAFNSDGGDSAQMLMMNGDGTFALYPPRSYSAAMRLTLSADGNGAPNCVLAPQGGALMYWYVCETPERKSKLGARSGPRSTND